MNSLEFIQNFKIPVPERNISTPIATRIIPPNIPALPQSFVPAVLPSNTPLRHMTKVITAIISAAIIAEARLYSAIVKPTESASIDVAIP